MADGPGENPKSVADASEAFARAFVGDDACEAQRAVSRRRERRARTVDLLAHVVAVSVLVLILLAVAAAVVLLRVIF